VSGIALVLWYYACVGLSLRLHCTVLLCHVYQVSMPILTVSVFLSPCSSFYVPVSSYVYVGIVCIMYCSSDLTHVGCRWLRCLVVVVRVSRDAVVVEFVVVVSMSEDLLASNASLTLPVHATQSPCYSLLVSCHRLSCLVPLFLPFLFLLCPSCIRAPYMYVIVLCITRT